MSAAALEAVPRYMHQQADYGAGRRANKIASSTVLLCRVVPMGMPTSSSSSIQQLQD